jgi:phosphatidylserine decarboxylase
MGTTHVIIAAALTAASALGLFLFWRYVWFFRNPLRVIPEGRNIVSPADGKVVYVKKVKPHEEVLCVKRGVSLRIHDILREEGCGDMLLIGVFMSPFDVHYNRTPLAGVVEAIRRYPATRGVNRNMGLMHLRTVFGWAPYYRGSAHIGENERTVTRIRGEFKGEPVYCHVIQIAGKSVHGIESYVREGDSVAKGEIFGIIRIGSQVDLLLPLRDSMAVMVKPGDRVVAGEAILVA